MEVYPCDECGNDDCEKLIIDEEHETTCCSCRNLFPEDMCGKCFNDWVLDQNNEQYEFLKSQGMKECEICDAPSSQDRCPAHRA